MDRRVHLRITGLVQGVFYRATACLVAQELGLRGWVRNLPNGDVEATAEGPAPDVERFILWTKKGPELAQVASVTISDQPSSPGELHSFRVVR